MAPNDRPDMFALLRQLDEGKSTAAELSKSIAVLTAKLEPLLAAWVGDGTSGGLLVLINGLESRIKQLEKEQVKAELSERDRKLMWGSIICSLIAMVGTLITVLPQIFHR